MPCSSPLPPLGHTHFQGLFELLHDLVLNGGVTEDVVWGHTGLATVHKFSPGNTPVKIMQFVNHGSSLEIVHKLKSKALKAE